MPTYACVCLLVTQSCLTLCYPMDCSSPGSFVHGILQARILDLVATSFSNMNLSSSSLVAKLCLPLATPQTVACHVPLSMGFSRQDHWSGLPFPSPPLMHSLPYYQHFPPNCILVIKDKPTMRHYNCPNTEFIFGFPLRFIHCMGLNKCIKTCCLTT